MRLVDADALKVEFDKNCAMECACCDHATCNHVRNAVGCGLVNAAPTIDAIPVEWLSHRLMMAQKNGSAHTEQAIQYVLWLWEQQKDGEQEVHGT